jgi:alpha-ketoglutarate-dependent taurine dioxygenase
MNHNDIRNLGGQVFAVDVPALGQDAQCYVLQPGRPPLFIEPRTDRLLDRDRFRQWSRDVRPVLDALVTEHGGIVLRGFPIAQTDDFADFIDQFPSFEGGYAGGRAPREAISGRVMEATRLAASVRLALHSEMAYRRDYPSRIAFFSRKTAEVGGETLIGDVRNLVNDMAPQLVEKLETLGTRTAINFGPKSEGRDASYGHMDHRGWNHSFQTDDPAEVNRLCAERGLEPVWHEDGSLTVLNVLEPFVVHPQTGAKIYRSILHMKPQVENAALDLEMRKRQKYPTGATLGNGEKLEESERAHIDQLCDAVTYSWPWRNGDVMLLDNLQVWHGRNPYQGERDVQVALLA